ncbi:MAG: hypothetical protein Q8912_07240 [Bacillota bacterium]|nr:hypothetical protein [Bacillota bacterium]
MKKLVFGTILLAIIFVVPAVTMARVDVGIGISIPLPPVIAFEGPPAVVPLPDTSGVYVVPGITVDLFFWNGFWWRPWEGRWYRSPYYDRDWVYYGGIPTFYFSVDPYWRTYYHNHSWHGYIWNYRPIPHGELERNWKGWQRNRYWEGKRTWGVQGYKPKATQQREVIRQQRQTLYQQRPEVQQHQQFMRQQREQQRQPQRQEQFKGGAHQQPGGHEGKGGAHQQPKGHEGKGEEHR